MRSPLAEVRHRHRPADQRQGHRGRQQGRPVQRRTTLLTWQGARDGGNRPGLVHLRLEPLMQTRSHCPSPSVGERRPWRLIARESLDSETGRGSGGKQQRNDDPGHRLVLLQPPGGLARQPLPVTGHPRQSSDFLHAIYGRSAASRPIQLSSCNSEYPRVTVVDRE
jgi:hypothetical protein